MSPEFRDREKDGGACGLEICSCHVRGSCGAGAWALRPQRLQWLNHTGTSAFEIAAFLSKFRNSCTTFAITTGAFQRSSGLRFNFFPEF